MHSESQIMCKLNVSNIFTMTCLFSITEMDGIMFAWMVYMNL